jgi:hypothetical protein
MAILSGSTLTGCNYIPDFIASGTIMLFENTTSPTSWTKITTFNDTSCRIVSGSISNGGSTAFSTIFSTRSGSGTVNQTTSTTNWNSSTASVTINSATAGSISLNPGLFYSSSHTHTYSLNTTTQRSGGPVLGYPSTPTTRYAPAIGGSSPHTHGASLSSSPHTHTASTQPHSHSLSWTHSHPGGISVSQNFNLYYVDVILASKD